VIFFLKHNLTIDYGIRAHMQLEKLEIHFHRGRREEKPIPMAKAKPKTKNLNQDILPHGMNMQELTRCRQTHY